MWPLIGKLEDQLVNGEEVLAVEREALSGRRVA
jgi:hypothetical protein